MTLGNEGAYLRWKNNWFYIPPYPTIEVDPTGCGDSFAGSLLAYLVGRQGVLSDVKAIRNALVHATVTSSFTLGAIGTTGIVSIDRGVYHARVDRYRRIAGIK